MNKYIFLMLPFLLLLSGCESNIAYSPMRGLKHEKLSPRAEPANVTKKSDDSLKQEGYLKIGWIIRREVTKTYWADKSYLHLDPLDCPAPVIQRDFTQELCQEAAAHGGDLVTVTVENKPDKREVSKHGKATAWTEKTIEVAIPHYDRATGPTGAPKDYTMVTRTTYQTQTIRTPTAWEDVFGIECSILSEGTVWRQDTELIKRISERQERLRRIEAERKERLIASSKGLTPNNVGDKWGYLDNNGKTVIEPELDHAWGFSEGMARIKVGEKQGYIDSAGKVVIKPQFDAAREFSEGVAFVGRGEFLKWKWGCIDKSGTLLIEYKFDDAEKFSEGLAAVANGPMFNENRWGYIDKTGGWVIRPSFYNAKEFSDGLAPVAIGGLMTKKWGYITREAQVVIKPQFDEAFCFSEGLAEVKVGEKFGFIDKTGKVIIKPRFDKAEQFIAGWARVEVDDNDVGYINKSEELLFE